MTSSPAPNRPITPPPSCTNQELDELPPYTVSRGAPPTPSASSSSPAAPSWTDASAWSLDLEAAMARPPQRPTPAHIVPQDSEEPPPAYEAGPSIYVAAAPTVQVITTRVTRTKRRKRDAISTLCVLLLLIGAIAILIKYAS